MAHLLLNGTGDHASSPDAVPLDITGDIDVRFYGAAVDWTQSSGQVFLSKYDHSTELAYYFGVYGFGLIIFRWRTPGGSTIFEDSSVAVGFADGSDQWIRATLDVDNGAAGYDVKFYTGGSAATPSWSQLGTTQTGGATTSIRNSSAPVRVGVYGNTFLEPFVGKVYRAQILSGIDGTLAFDANFSDPITWTFS